MVGFMVAGLALAADRRPVAGVVGCALAMAIKATAVVALPFAALLWLQRSPDRPRPLVRAIAATLLTAGVTFAAVTVVSGVGYGWVDTVQTVGLSRQWTSLPTGLGLALAGAAHLVGLHVDTSTVLGGVRTVAGALTAGLLVWLWVRGARKGGTRSILEHCGWALLVVVVLSPAVHPWYVTWPVTALATAGIGGRPRTAIVATSAALCFLVLPDGYNLARATEPVGVALDVAVACGLAVFGIVKLRRLRSADPVAA
jgi:hypothetical protein